MHVCKFHSCECMCCLGEFVCCGFGCVFAHVNECMSRVSSPDAKADLPFECKTLSLCLPSSSRRREEERERKGYTPNPIINLSIHIILSNPLIIPHFQCTAAFSGLFACHVQLLRMESVCVIAQMLS